MYRVAAIVLQYVGLAAEQSLRVQLYISLCMRKQFGFIFFYYYFLIQFYAPLARDPKSRRCQNFGLPYTTLALRFDGFF